MPDPVVGLTLFLASPETRVGPQQASLSVSQSLPWFGKLRLREQAAVLAAAAAHARAEAEALRLITDTRRLVYELGYLAEQERVVGEDIATLEHYEELARARYESGVGLAQTVIKIQAEITRGESRLLEIEERRAAVTAELNALRDRQESLPVSAAALPAAEQVLGSYDSLREQAVNGRPEVTAADFEIERAATLVELAEKAYRPDLRVGLSYTLVGRRDDDAGRADPPQGNGDDILGLTGSVNLPIRRDRLAAEVEEAVAERLAAEEARRAVIADIEGEVSEVVARLPLIRDQVRLLADVLTPQAEQSLLSAEAGYATGSHGALDLLDAERTLLQIRIAAARARADHAIARARLEGVVALPVGSGDSHE
jgi:outer membrane protein TolC